MQNPDLEAVFSLISDWQRHHRMWSDAVQATNKANALAEADGLRAGSAERKALVSVAYRAEEDCLIGVQAARYKVLAALCAMGAHKLDSKLTLEMLKPVIGGGDRDFG